MLMRPFLLEHGAVKTAFQTRNLALQAIAGPWMDASALNRLEKDESTHATLALEGRSDVGLSSLLAGFIQETVTLAAKQTPEQPKETAPATAAPQEAMPHIAHEHEVGLQWSFSPDMPVLTFPIHPRMRPNANTPYFMPLTQTQQEQTFFKRVLSNFLSDDTRKSPSVSETFKQIRAQPAAPAATLAIQTLAAQTDNNPTYSFEWLQTGMELMKARQLSSAIKALEHAVSADARNDAAINNLAGALVLAGRHEQARQLLQDGLKQAKAGAFIRFNLGIAHLLLNRFKEAAVDFMRVRSLLAGNINLPADFLEGFCRYQNLDFKAAESVFRTLAERDPGDIHTRFNYALCQMRCAHHETALEDLDAVLQAAPEDTQALVLRALARSLCSQQAEAIRDLDSAIAAEPANLSFYMARALLFRGQGRIDMALADLQRIMRLVPGHDKFRTLFAQIRQEIQGEPARNDENTLPAQPTLG